MAEDSEADLKLEIGHVLLIDIVGYSKLLITEQRERLQALKEIVRNAAQFRASDASGMLVRISTGDGMALIFRDSVEAPVRCALEISQAVKNHPEIHLRMGIHSGPQITIQSVDSLGAFTHVIMNACDVRQVLGLPSELSAVSLLGAETVGKIERRLICLVESSHFSTG